MKHKRTSRAILHSVLPLLALVQLTAATSGCWLIAAGAGAEAGYVAAQDDRTASETLTDQRITVSVKSLLLSNAATPGLDINVDTFKTNVTLRGVVHTAEQKEESMRLAASVEGVGTVVSELRVVP